MRRAAGFTLIEMLAVVAIFALMAAIVAPRLGVIGRRTLHHEAERLAARLELARQRSVVTAVPHRLALDLDGARWQLQWLQSDPADAERLADEEAALLDPTSSVPLSLEAPPAPELAYAAVPGSLGHWNPMDDNVLFSGVETPEGWIEGGEAYVAFESDGSANYTVIVLGNEDGDALELEVLPLADVVRIRDEAD